MAPDEIWIIIAEAPSYAVSSLGRVKRVVPDRLNRPCRVLATPINDKGYPHLNLHVEGRQHLRRVHALVCEAFHGPRPTPKHQVRHLDGDKANNREGNLAWGTFSENALDNVRLGRCRQKGTKGAPIPINVVRDIKFSVKSHRQLVREHGVCKASVWMIRTGRQHKNVKAA